MPTPDVFAVEIPLVEKRRAGLNLDRRQWLVLQECNEDQLPGSHYIENQPPLGKLGKKFLLPLVRELIRRIKVTRVVNRTT